MAIYEQVKGEHVATNTYDADDMVYGYDTLNVKGLYVAIQAVPAGIAITDTNYWKLVISTPNKFIEFGLESDLKGEWSGAQPWLKSDIVSYTNGNSVTSIYVAIQDVPLATSLTDTTYWQFFTSYMDFDNFQDTITSVTLVKTIAQFTGVTVADVVEFDLNKLITGKLVMYYEYNNTVYRFWDAPTGYITDADFDGETGTITTESGTYEVVTLAEYNKRIKWMLNPVYADATEFDEEATYDKGDKIYQNVSGSMVKTFYAANDTIPAGTDPTSDSRWVKVFSEFDESLFATVLFDENAKTIVSAITGLDESEIGIYYDGESSDLTDAKAFIDSATGKVWTALGDALDGTATSFTPDGTSGELVTSSGTYTVYTWDQYKLMILRRVMANMNFKYWPVNPYENIAVNDKITDTVNGIFYGGVGYALDGTATGVVGIVDIDNMTVTIGGTSYNLTQMDIVSITTTVNTLTALLASTEGAANVGVSNENFENVQDQLDKFEAALSISDQLLPENYLGEFSTTISFETASNWALDSDNVAWKPLAATELPYTPDSSTPDTDYVESVEKMTKKSVGESISVASYQLNGVQVSSGSLFVESAVDDIVPVGITSFLFDGVLWHLGTAYPITTTELTLTAYDLDAGTVTLSNTTYYIYAGYKIGECAYDLYSPNKNAKTSVAESYIKGDATYLYPTVTLTSGTSDTVQFTKALTHAVHAGVPLNTGLGNSYISLTGTISTDEGFDVRIIGECKFFVDGWNNCTSSNGQSISAYNMFNFGLGGSDYTSISNVLEIGGKLEFWNLDTSVNTRVMACSSTAQYVMFGNLKNQTKFRLFTVVGYVGFLATSDGIHTNSDAHTTVLGGNVSIDVISDTVSTSQEPKGIHFSCVMNVFYRKSRIVGAGIGYLFRFSGGRIDTVPRIGYGCSRSGAIDNEFITVATGIPYNQFAKSTYMTFTHNVCDATYGEIPHNAIDIFNCQHCCVNHNICEGGGIAFFGHGDLNTGSYPGEMIAPRDIKCNFNIIKNPTHYSVINFGGDGTVDGNRAMHDGEVVGNTVLVDDDHEFPQDCQFFYGFLCNEVRFSDNWIEKIPYMRAYYCKSMTIDNETLIDVENEVYESTEGDTGSMFSVGRLIRRGTSDDSTRLEDSSYAFPMIVAGDQNFNGDVTISGTLSGMRRVASAYNGGSYTSSSSASVDVTMNLSSDMKVLVTVGWQQAASGSNTAANIAIMSFTASAYNTTWLVQDNTGITMTAEVSDGVWTITATAGTSTGSTRMSAIVLL